MRSLAPRLLLVAALAGCVVDVRQTTTARTPQEMLRMSFAAERAVLGFDPRPLRGRTAFVRVAGLEDVPERAFYMKGGLDEVREEATRS